MVTPMRKRLALPKAIRALREAKGITVSQLATATQMSTAHLCNIEAERRRPTDAHVEAIAAALAVDIDAISISLDTFTEAAA